MRLLISTTNANAKRNMIDEMHKTKLNQFELVYL